MSRGSILSAILVLSCFYAITASEECQRFHPPDCKTEFATPSYHPHETLCELYYRCDHGVDAIFACPPGQSFNTIERICQMKENVSCNRCKYIDFPDTGGGGEKIESLNVRNRERINTFVEECPVTPSCTIAEVGVMKPYPPDCTKYIYCNDFGESILSSCSVNLHFSPHLGYCTSPVTAECTYCEIPTTTAPIITTSPFCPETPTCNISDVGVMKPYPPDCSKYIYCNSFGESILSTCAINLHFSPHLGYCTLPDVALCPLCDEIETTTPTVTTIPTCPDLPICGTTDLGAMLPYPPDCRRYIYCSGPNSPQIRVCYKDWHFDHNLLHCDIADNVFCPTCTTEEPISTTELITTIAVCPTTPKCTVTDFGALKPFPPDCSKYIYCDELGNENIRLCPVNAHFSSVLKHCTAISEANCPYCEEPINEKEISFNRDQENNRHTKNIATVIKKIGTAKNECDYVSNCTIEDIGALKPYPPDCSYFIYCDENSNDVLSKCPNSLHFSPMELYCMEPQQAQCKDCVSTTETPSTTIAACEEVLPCNDEDVGVIKPYPPDCNMYVYCDENSNAILSKCPFDLHFSPSLLYCTTPVEALCPECQAITTSSEPPPTTIAICEDIPTCSISEIGVEKPYPPDCSMYIYCDEFGNEIISKCPSDFYFSPSNLYCMPIADANCPLCEVLPITTIPSSTTELSTTVSICPEIPTCVASDYGKVKPFPPDCSMYIYCDELNNGVISKCPNDNHFSPTNLYCMPIDEANCPECEIQQSSTTTEQSTTTELLTTINICPEIPTCTILEYGEVKPYPPDCSMYIYCDDKGNTVLSKCSSDLHFSPIDLYCTAPADAKCPFCESISTSPASTSTTDMQTTIAVCADTPTCSINEEGEIKPYPPDCTSYLYCNSNGNAILSQCPEGLYFSPLLLHCTTFEEAECPLCEIPTTTIEPTTTTEVISTTIGICPPTPTCEGALTGTLLPYPLDCNFYIFCDDTEAAVIESCSPGLHFSPETLECTSPEEANCPVCGLEETTPETTYSTESSTLSTFLPSSTVFVCPSIPTCLLNETGQTKPYPPDCNFYVYCNGSINGDLRKCARDLHFDTIALKCIDPSLSNCKACETMTSTSTFETTANVETTTSTFSSTTDDVSTLPPCADTPTCSLFETGVHKAYPPDCTKYIYCDISGPVITPCPIGEHFSPHNNTCMAPDLAYCPLCSEVMTSSTITITTIITTDMDSTTQEVTTLESTTAELTSPSSSLPPCAETPICTVFENGVQKPYPIDCTKYLLCTFGSPLIQSCLPGEHFSPTEFKCMDSTIANCPLCSEVITTTTLSTSTEEPTTEELSTTETTIVTTSTFESTSEEGTTLPSSTLQPCVATPTCTVFENGVKKPFPPNCEQYLQCSFGSPIIESCPPEQHFSPTEYTCQDPLTANCPLCSEQETTVTTESVTSTVEPTTTTEEPTTTEPITTTPAFPYCPATPTCGLMENGITKPYPPDCQYYVYCNFGSFELRKCKTGFEYSPTEYKCVDAALAKCPMCTPN